MINTILIWEPKYSTRKVLIDPLKVQEHNIIRFTKGTYKDREYYIKGSTIKSYDKQSNGKIMCHAVDLDVLEPLAEPEGV